TGSGADVIYDPVGGDVFDGSSKCLNFEGRLLVIGFAGGRIPEIAANRILLKNISVVGVHWGLYQERQSPLIARWMNELLALRQVRALGDRAWECVGAVHVRRNSGGVAGWGGLETATHRDWQWVLGVNLWGVIHGIEAFVPRMTARKSEGHIVNTASMAGLI